MAESRRKEKNERRTRDEARRRNEKGGRIIERETKKRIVVNGGPWDS